MTFERGFLLCYVGFAAVLVALTVLAPFIGDGFGFLEFVLFFTAVPLLSLAVVAQALWRPTWRKAGTASAALGAAAVAFPLAIGPAPAAGDWLLFRARRGVLDAFARDALAARASRPDVDPCDAGPVRERASALGFLGCRAEADRVALVAGGLLNREHGYVYIRSGSRLRAQGEPTVGTRLSLGGALGGGWYSYAGR